METDDNCAGDGDADAATEGAAAVPGTGGDDDAVGDVGIDLDNDPVMAKIAEMEGWTIDLEPDSEQHDDKTAEGHDGNSGPEDSGQEIADDNEDDADSTNSAADKEEPEQVISAPGPGRWRLGVAHQLATALFMRFANTGDKKLPNAERHSEYYQKHGNPNYGNLKGVISQSMRDRFRHARLREESRQARMAVEEHQRLKAGPPSRRLQTSQIKDLATEIQNSVAKQGFNLKEVTDQWSRLSQLTGAGRTVVGLPAPTDGDQPLSETDQYMLDLQSLLNKNDDDDDIDEEKKSSWHDNKEAGSQPKAGGVRDLRTILGARRRLGQTTKPVSRRPAPIRLDPQLGAKEAQRSKRKRSGSVSSSESDGEETAAKTSRPSKMPRMRMRADEEEDRPTRRQEVSFAASPTDLERTSVHRRLGGAGRSRRLPLKSRLGGAATINIDDAAGRWRPSLGRRHEDGVPLSSRFGRRSGLNPYDEHDDRHLGE